MPCSCLKKNMLKFLKPISIGAMICLLIAIGLLIYGKGDSGFFVGMACGLAIIPITMSFEIRRIKKQVHFKAKSEEEELYHEEIITLTKGQSHVVWGKLFVTNFGLRFEDRKKKAVWEALYSEIESVKEKKIFNLHLNVLTHGEITIFSDNRKHLKDRILQSM